MPPIAPTMRWFLATTPSWKYVPENSDQGGVGALSAEARFDWNDVNGQTLRFELPEGFTDAVGAAPTAWPTSATISVADLGKATQSREFDGPSLGAAGSENVALESSTPACEGSCARVGPVVVACTEQMIAGVLDASAGHKVVLRTRFASAYSSSRLNVTVAIIGDDGQRLSMPFERETSNFEDLGTGLSDETTSAASARGRPTTCRRRSATPRP
jgi:hypothetical protein